MTLNFERVKGGVQAITSKVALKGEGDMTRAAILEDDSTLEQFYKEAMGLLQMVLGRFCTGLAEAVGYYTFTLSEPETWGSDENRVERLAESYAINHVCACWFDAVKPEQAAAYRTEEELLSQAIYRELTLRKKPTRP